MTNVVMQSLDVDYSINWISSKQKNSTQINLALLVSFILHMELHSSEKGQIPQAFILPLDFQEGTFSRETKLE